MEDLEDCMIVPFNGHEWTLLDPWVDLGGPWDAPGRWMPLTFGSRQIPEHLGEWLKIYRRARGEYEAMGK